MKKVILSLGVVALFTLASCNKEKDCECVTTVDGVEMSNDIVPIEDGECSDLESNSTDFGITTSVTCEEV